MSKTFTVIIILVIVLAISTVFTVVLIHWNQNTAQQTGTYTVIGALNYAPGNAIYPGVSVTSVSPSLSPSPSARTFSQPDGRGGTLNATVNAFIFLSFSGKFSIPPISTAPDFPTGFAQGDVVKLSGNISYETSYQAYVMNVTSISHIVS
jgi:hypothetical protein